MYALSDKFKQQAREKMRKISCIRKGKEGHTKTYSPVGKKKRKERVLRVSLRRNTTFKEITEKREGNLMIMRRNNISCGAEGGSLQFLY